MTRGPPTTTMFLLERKKIELVGLWELVVAL
jgi:hypothetical protein